MKKWEDIRKKYKTIEIGGIVGMILCLIIGSFCDWNVERGNILIPVDDMESFSLTILQIQATVGTLIVAIIALITGNISDSYMGVSVSDFYLNIRPWKLKQKVLIFVSLGLCVAGVISHSLKLFNIVFWLFNATLIAISISIIEIYSAFRGKNTADLEIEAYINHVLESDMEFKKKLDIYQNFVLDWKSEIDSQNKQSYEKFFEIFKNGMITIWSYETDESLVAIQQQCYDIVYCFLGSEKNQIKERGIEFVQNIYDVLWGEITKYILENKPLLNKYKKGFSLFAELGEELIQSIDTLNVENIEKIVKFSRLSDSVQRVTIWLSYDQGEKQEGKRYGNSYENEIRELHFFARYLGHYLGKQKNKGNIINQKIWASALNGWSIFSSYNIPEERREDFLQVKAIAYFNYCYGMLLNGQENVVKQGLYLHGMSKAVKLDNKYQVLLYLSIHCYLYYLAEREGDDCVSDSVRQAAKSILDDGKVKSAFGNFLDMLAENVEWLDLDMPEQIYNILDRYELFPKYGSAKTMIMEYVVSDFYLFIILFMSHEYFLQGLLEKNIDDMSAFRYVSSGNEENTKKLFCSLYKKIFTGAKEDERINVEVDLMYDNLEKKVKKLQKERYIKQARNEQRKYEATINENEICEKIKTDVMMKIKEKFSSILVDEDKKNGIIRINLLKVENYTDSIEKKYIDGFYSHMDGMFLFGIENFLCKRKVVEFRNRFDDFSDDKEFMEYLDVNELKLLFGSQFILKNRDYKNSNEFNKFLDDYETIYTAIVNNGMALKRDALQVCLHDISVSIHSPNINEVQAEYDAKTGKYIYSIINGLPIDFEERELEEFLYNNRKVINITAKVSVQINEKPVGTIITGKKRTAMK